MEIFSVLYTIFWDSTFSFEKFQDILRIVALSRLFVWTHSSCRPNQKLINTFNSGLIATHHDSTRYGGTFWELSILQNKTGFTSTWFSLFLIVLLQKQCPIVGFFVASQLRLIFQLLRYVNLKEHVFFKTQWVTYPEVMMDCFKSSDNFVATGVEEVFLFLFLSFVCIFG